MFFFNLEIKDNFELAEIFYEIHIIGNYTLIALISLHIFAVIIHKILFKENLLKEFYKIIQINLSLNLIIFLYFNSIS